MSNRDRIGRGFELLADGMEPFIDELMSAAMPDERHWVEVLEARDSQKFGGDRTYEPTDPQVQLKVLTEEWRVFKDRLSRPEQAIASELREVRNQWAHNAAFSTADTERALDSMQRLLTLAGAVEQAEAVHGMWLDLRRAHFEEQTRKAVKAAATVSVPGTGVKPWREVIHPHPDVQSGNFNAAEFAADLHRVARGEGAQEYVEAVEFFRRTYLTEGLRDLLVRGARRLAGDTNAVPIFNLQTNFGGGKTHSMLALYHLCSGTPLAEYPQEVQEVLAGHDVTATPIRRVTLVGNHEPPGTPSVKDDGTTVKTFWGELAWQLGGRAAYDMVADADRTATNPGDQLATLIEAHAPCLILIDEWVAYARQLYGRDDLPAGTFDTQFTFAQTLTEVVKAVPGALLVVSIPASSDSSGPDDGPGGGSDLEVGGTHGKEALKRLQNVVRRVADQWRPASSRESFEIVRRRLFEEPGADAKADISAVARQFVEFYSQHRGEFPRECGEMAYEDRIKAAYPIHPELFDRLYEDWSTLERFQRTRGVLRLMSTVIHELWRGNDAGPLIMPGSVALDAPLVSGEMLQYLPDSWAPIVDADVDGESATSVEIDGQRSTFGQRSLTRRIARTIFVGAAPTLHTSHKGIERQHVWLGVGVPGDTVGNFGSALEVLSQRATYLYVDGARYWFDTQASVTRTAQDHADRLRDQPELVWAELVRRLAGQRSRPGDFAAAHVCPEDTGAVPDTEEAKLVVLHPQHTHARGSDQSAARRFAQQVMDTRGASQRVNRNTLVFLAADDRRYEEVAEATRDFLAWQSICERVTELNLTQQQAAQAQTRRDQADDTVTLRIASAWIWALVPEQLDPARPAGWSAMKAEGSQEGLAERVSAKLKQGGLLATTYGARNVRMDLDGPLAALWEDGHVTVAELWSCYRRYPYLTRLRDRSVLEGALSSVDGDPMWEHEGFALADAHDETTDRYTGLVAYNHGAVGLVTDGTLVVRPDRAVAQFAAASAEAAESDPAFPHAAPGVSAETPAGAPAEPTAERGPSDVRFFGAMTLDPERYGRDFNKLAQEVLAHLTADDGARLRLTVEVEAVNEAGFDPDKVRIVTENARTLRFDQYGFEDQ